MIAVPSISDISFQVKSIKKPVKFLTNYTTEDINKRVDKIGVHLSIVHYFLIDYLGAGFTNVELMQLAQNVSQRLGIYLDRMAKRNKNALLCWFAENWVAIYPCLQQLPPPQKKKPEIKFEISPYMPQKPVFDPTDVLQLLNRH